MKSRTTKERAGLAGGMLAALLLAGQASAVPINITGFAYGSQVVDIDAPVNQNVNAGAFSALINNAAPSVLAWCADLFTNISIPNTYQYTPAGPLPAFPNANALANLGALASNALSLVNNADTSAAFQLAVWEILYESSPSAVNSGAGFKVGNNPSSVGIANGWLAQLGTWNNTLNYTVDFYGKVPGVKATQDLIVFRRVPVPEPGSFALMLLGSAGAGLLVLRRRRT
jgi:hypothetical protein